MLEGADHFRRGDGGYLRLRAGGKVQERFRRFARQMFGKIEDRVFCDDLYVGKPIDRYAIAKKHVIRDIGE